MTLLNIDFNPMCMHEYMNIVTFVLLQMVQLKKIPKKFKQQITSVSRPNFKLWLFMARKLINVKIRKK